MPDLPYPYDALELHISAETMRFHHDRHHRTYVDKANAAVPEVADILVREVTVCSAQRRFGEVTADEARQHSTELTALAGWRPMAKVGAIARAWATSPTR